MESGDIQPAVQQRESFSLEWFLFGITFSAALPGFLKPKTVLLLERRALLPLPSPDPLRLKTRKGKIKVQMARFERKHFNFFPPVLSEDGFK